LNDITGFNGYDIGIYQSETNNWKNISNWEYSGELEISDSLYLTFEENDPEGIWFVYYISMSFEVGNNKTYYSDELEEMGFPTEIFVTYGESLCDLLGDVNNDLILNVQDIVLIINLILDGEYNECGDVNSDGTINVQDVVIFVNIILSIP
jgi:hypothetical protein